MMDHLTSNTTAVNHSLWDTVIMQAASPNWTSDYPMTTSPTSSPYIFPGHQIPMMIIRGVVFLIATVLGIFGNVLALIVLRRRVLNVTASTYMTGQAVSDLLFLIVFSPTALKVFSDVKMLRSYQTFYAFYVCYVFPLVSVFHTSCVWITVAFTVGRVICVAYPMKAQRICTQFRAGISVGLAFLFAFALNCTRFFRRTVIQKFDNATQESYYSYTLTSLALRRDLEDAYFWFYVSATKLVPFPLLTVLNIFVIRNVLRARRTREDEIAKVKVADDHSQSRENQMTRMLIAICVAFMICNVLAGIGSMYIALYGIKALYRPSLFVFYLFGLGETFINCNPLLNSILYTACSHAMRTEMRKTLSCKTVPRRKLSLASKSLYISGERKSSLSGNCLRSDTSLPISLSYNKMALGDNLFFIN